MNLVCTDGVGGPWTGDVAGDWADSRYARLFDQIVSVPCPRWSTNWKPGDGEYVATQIPPGPFVIHGLSDSAPISLEVGVLHPDCAGVVFTSGLYRELPRGDWFTPSTLCICTDGEKRRLQRETERTFTELVRRGVDATFHRSGRPRRWFPHLAGITHHQQYIISWMRSRKII